MNDVWPALPFSEWKATCKTLHMWTQIVGKIRLTLTPWINHSWHVTLYLTARGLTTSPMYVGNSPFQIDFDFVDHKLLVITKNDAAHEVPLVSCSVATFYKEVIGLLDA